MDRMSELARLRQPVLRPGISLQPEWNVEVIELLAPDEARKGLTLDVAGVLRGDVLLQVTVEGVALGAPRRQEAFEIMERRRYRAARQAQAVLHAAARRHQGLIPGRRLRAGACGIHVSALGKDDAAMEGVLEIA